MPLKNTIKNNYLYFSMSISCLILVISVIFLYGGRIPTALAATNLVQNPGFEQDFTSWSHSHSPATSTAIEEITTTGCYSGKCVKLSPGNCTSQRVSQQVGILEPGKTYLLAARFKTATTHNAYINLRDMDWKDTSCTLAVKYNVKNMQGTGEWEQIRFYFTVPATDDCGQATDSHNWSVYFYGHYPTGDTNPIYYDEVTLVPVLTTPPAGPPKNWPWRGIVLQYKYPEENMSPYSDPDPFPKPEDITLLKQMGVNMVTLTLNIPQAIKRAKAYDDVTLTIQQAFDLNMAWANQMLDACRDAEIVAHVRMQDFPLDPADTTDKTSDAFWNNQTLLDQVVEYAGKIAQNLSSRGDELQAYSIIGEPVLNLRNPPRATIPPQWPALRERIITTIRGNDTNRNRWIVISPGPGGRVGGYDASSDPNALQAPLDDPKIIYNHHFYQPHSFTAQFAISADDNWPPSTYPGTINGVFWSKTQMEEYLKPLIDFQKKYGVLVNTGEFSAIRWANGFSQWLQDAIDLFEKYKFSWAFFSYKNNNIWDPRFNEFTYDDWIAQNSPYCNSIGKSGTDCWLAFIQKYRANCKYGDYYNGTSLCWSNDYQGYDTKRWAVLKAAYSKNPTTCGNSICEPGETPQTCPADCHPPAAPSGVTVN